MKFLPRGNAAWTRHLFFFAIVGQWGKMNCREWNLLLQDTPSRAKFYQNSCVCEIRGFISCWYRFTPSIISTRCDACQVSFSWRANTFVENGEMLQSCRLKSLARWIFYGRSWVWLGKYKICRDFFTWFLLVCFPLYHRSKATVFLNGYKLLGILHFRAGIFPKNSNRHLPHWPSKGMRAG